VLLGDRKTPVPADLSELTLCRDVYHCTPVELAKVPYETIQRHWAVMEAENQVRNLKAGKYDQKRGLNGGSQSKRNRNG
jgi:hypothetical protein